VKYHKAKAEHGKVLSSLLPTPQTLDKVSGYDIMEVERVRESLTFPNPSFWFLPNTEEPESQEFS